MIRSIFISRDPSDVPLLTDYCRANKINLKACSLIRFEGIEAHPSKPFDIIFFPSIRAAQFFLASNALNENVVVACIGKQSAEKLKSIGLRPNFVGEKSGDPESVAQAFALFTGNKRVLIPSSTESNRSIQTNLRNERMETLDVYRTIPDPIEIETSDVYVFSSPSNLYAYLAKNTLPEGAKTVAWGTTTQHAFKRFGISCSHVLQHAKESDLIDWLKQNG